MKKAIHIGFVALVLASCTRNSLPDPASFDPVFVARYTLDGADAEIAAGVNGYYLEPSFHRGSNGVLEYVATFKNLTNSLTELEVVIQDDNWELPTAPVQPDVALATGMLDFQENDIVLDDTQLVFCSFAGLEGKTYEWVINGQEYSESIPSIALSGPGEILQAKVYITDDLTGCVDSLSQSCEIFDGSGQYGSYYYESFSVNRLNNNNQVRLSYDGNFNEVAEIRWDILDDGNAIIVNDLEEVIHTFSTAGPHMVTVTVELENGHIFQYADRVATSDEVCTANMHFLRPPLDDPATSRVRVNYTSPEGVHYSSYVPGVTNAADNSFEIVNIEDFNYNDLDSGQETLARRLDVTFSCILYNLANTADQITIENFEGGVAVTFPQ